jgi:hypothetical protein
VKSAAVGARRRPALALYLAALALLPFKWLSPLAYEQAGLTDIFIALALVAWVVESVRGGSRPRVRPIHVAYAAFAAAVVLAAAFAHNHRLAAENVLITCELIALAVMTAAYWSAPLGRRAISRVVIGAVVFTAALSVLGLVLFYLGVDTSLTQSYSGYFKASDLYTRVAAGFESAPLLGSWCIFASAVIAMDVLRLSRRTRMILQTTLFVLTLLTLSRAFVGFVLAAAIRASRSHDRRARRVAPVVVACSLAVTVALTVLPLTLSPLRPASSREDTNPRLSTIETSAKTFWKRPLVGAGPGTLTATWQQSRYRAHFTPLNVAATSGLPALVALAGAVVILWRGRGRTRSLVVWSGLAGLGLDALGQDAEHFRHVWIMLGIADAERADTDS